MPLLRNHCGSFSPPRMIAELSEPDAEETEPTLTPDELEIYFCSTRIAGRRQIFVATRTSSSDRWTVPTLVQEFVSDTGITYSPEISRDGRTLWFVSDRPGGRGDIDIYVSTRTEPRSTLVHSRQCDRSQYGILRDRSGAVARTRPDGRDSLRQHRPQSYEPGPADRSRRTLGASGISSIS